jgi:hypothetical protein
MPAWRRPSIPRPVFRDPAGQVIEYGRRWRGHPAPRETYSVVTHPERFEPLADVAAALVEHLATTYQVSQAEGPAVMSDLLGPLVRPVRWAVRWAARLTPPDHLAAPLTIAVTDHPAVVVCAGVLHEATYPDCGCDACDPDIEDLAESLEQLVFAVVSGHFGEFVTGPWRRRPIEPHRRRASTWTGYWIDHPGGRNSGASQASPLVRPKLAQAKRALRALSGQPWHPWSPA